MNSVHSSAVDVRVSEVEVVGVRRGAGATGNENGNGNGNENENENETGNETGNGNGLRRDEDIVECAETEDRPSTSASASASTESSVESVPGTPSAFQYVTGNEGDDDGPSSSSSPSSPSPTSSRSSSLSAFKSINEARHQLKFLVPNTISGCIIGKNGSNLERIQEQSGAFIQANAPGFAVHSNRLRFIIIAGDSMERCLHGLALLLESVKAADKMHLLKTNAHEDDPRMYLKQIIPGGCAGNIIGVKGGGVAKISRERGLSVFVEPKPLHATTVPFRIVSYAGSSVDQLIGGVQGVVGELQSADGYMEQYAAEIKEIKSVVIKVLRIPSGRVGALIGPKGAHLHALQEVLKCKLAIGKSDDEEEDGDGGGDFSGDFGGDSGEKEGTGGGCYLTVWGQPENVRAAVSVAKLQGGREVRSRRRSPK